MSVALPGSVAPRSVRAAPRLRPTLRARRLLPAGIVLVIAMGMLVRAPVAEGSAPTSPHSAVLPPQTSAARHTVVVGEGETLWTLAQRHSPRGVGVGQYAGALARANRVDARRLRPGSVLRLPQ